MVKCMIIEGKKALFDKGIILTAIGIFIINLVNLWDEIQLHPTYKSSSVLYFWVNRHGLGGITILIFLLCSIPYGIQFCLEKSNGSWKYFLIREKFFCYAISKIVITVLTSVLASLGGYLLLFMFMIRKYTLYPDNQIFFEQMVDHLPFAQLALQERPIFFFLNIIPEVMMIAFLSTLSIVAATWSENKYVVIAAPVIVYYGWNYLTGSMRLPEIFLWPLKILDGFQYFENDAANCFFTIGYYLAGIIITGCIFFKRCKGDMENV